MTLKLHKAHLLTGIFCLMALISHATRPTVQPSNLTVNNINCNSVNINWTDGDGKMRLIVAHEGSLPTYSPVDGLAYTQDPTFGQGTEYDVPNKNFIVFNATGVNYVQVKNLLPGKTYYFVMYEHDNDPTNTLYLTANAPSISVTTYDASLSFATLVLDSCQMSNSFRFTNTSTSTIPGIKYYFDFGNSDTTSKTPVTHRFSSAGLVNVYLRTITSYTGCPASYVRNVRIFQKKVAFIDKTLFKDTQCLEDNFYRLETKPVTGQFPLSLRYKWFMGNGDSDTYAKQKYKYKTSGVFKIQLELTIYFNNLITNCKDTLSYDVTVLPSPVGSLNINNTDQCLKNNEFVFNNPDNTLNYFRWHFGDNDSSDLQTVTHRYKSVGTYKVIHIAFANTGCKGRDTVDVRVLPDINSSFTGLDTFYCASKTVDLITPSVSGGTFSGYPMNGNDLTPNTVGTHSLTYILKDQYCSDTTTQSFRIAPVPSPYIGRDTAICSALNYNISTTEPGTYLWNTGATTSSISVSNTGTYFVDVTLGKCSASDTMSIVFSKAPKVQLGSDTVLCKGGGLWLNASSPKSTYLWSTGSTDSAIYAFNAGKYKVTVSNPCGQVQDSLFIFQQNEYCDLFMANAFTPGNDLVNNVFMPRGRNITVKLFQIYNRWGELVFETDQNNVGWDGTYKGEYVQEGLYIWKLFYNTQNGPYIKKNNAFGQILLIK